jgi:hypothetical protein
MIWEAILFQCREQDFIFMMTNSTQLLFPNILETKYFDDVSFSVAKEKKINFSFISGYVLI